MRRLIRGVWTYYRCETRPSAADHSLAAQLLNPMCKFSGGAPLVTEVGRPVVGQEDQGMTQQHLPQQPIRQMQEVARPHPSFTK
jgi:hypothetical protein